MRRGAVVRRISIITLLGCVSSGGSLRAQDKSSSLSDPNLEAAEAKVTADTLLSQNDALRKQLSLDQQTVKTMTDSLVVSNSEAELFRRKFADLQTRMDALGVESVSKDRAKLEQRLLKAVSDLQILQKENDAYREQLLQLSETVLRYVKTTQSADANARADLETQLRATNKLVAKEHSLGAPNEPETPTLLDAKVISVKEEWSLVVGNIGAEQGVKIGMPLRVVRNGRNIAALRVVDVRDHISGAVVQEMGSERDRIRVGDRLQVDARPSVSQN